MQFLSIEGSLEAHDILAELVCQITKINESTAREVIHILAGRLQALIN